MEVLNEMEAYRNDIELQIIDICYHVQSFDWNTVWGLSPRARERIIKRVNRINEKEAQAMKDATTGGNMGALF